MAALLKYSRERQKLGDELPTAGVQRPPLGVGQSHQWGQHQLF
jgi:hypothetical protein